MRTPDFTPYRRATVGFDRLFDRLEQTARNGGIDNYPPFDVEKLGEDEFVITIAVAGFRPEEVDMTAQANLLVVAGRRADGGDESGRTYLHRGIAARAFERRFELADYVQVKNATLDHGLLTIELAREIPEAMKPRKVAINAAGSTIAGSASAIEPANETSSTPSAKAA